MIEVVFNDSAAGSLKLAQHFGTGAYVKNTATSIGVIGNLDEQETLHSVAIRELLEKQELERELNRQLAWAEAVPLGGNPVDVFSFDLAWSIGSLNGKELLPGRLDVLKRRARIWAEYYPNVTAQTEENAATETDTPAELPDIAASLAKEAEAAHQKILDDVKQVYERVRQGEHVRIWYTEVPDEVCGLYWFLDLLSHISVSDDQVRLVRIPKVFMQQNNAVEYNHSGEIPVEEWYKLVPLEEKLKYKDLQLYQWYWRDLNPNDKQLCVLLNGRLLCVNADFYDNFILDMLAKSETGMPLNFLLGKLLGEFRGVSDVFYVERINTLIAEGKIQVAAETVSNSAEQNNWKRLLKIA